MQTVKTWLIDAKCLARLNSVASTHSNGRDEQRHQLEGDLLLVPENQKKLPSLEGATTPKITNCDFRAAQLLLSGRSTPCQVAQQGNSFAEAWHKICASLVTSGNGAFACIVSYASFYHALCFCQCLLSNSLVLMAFTESNVH